MNSGQTVEEFWDRFCEDSNGIYRGFEYQVWHFGNSPEMAQELADLVLVGKKTATASLSAVNEIKPEEAPIVGGISVFTDFYGTPLGVIRTVDIKHVPFHEVQPEFAALEGEGDRSLEYWRRVHREYFIKETRQLGLEFEETDLVCCEQFTLLFPK